MLWVCYNLYLTYSRTLIVFGLLYMDLPLGIVDTLFDCYNVVTGVMHEADDAYSIRSTWSCYWTNISHYHSIHGFRQNFQCFTVFTDGEGHQPTSLETVSIAQCSNFVVQICFFLLSRCSPTDRIILDWP